jgi:serine protease Do
MFKNANKLSAKKTFCAVLIKAILVVSLLSANTAPSAQEVSAGDEFASPFVKVAEEVSPSVVQITTAKIEVIKRRDMFEDFERFFGNPMFPEEFREFFGRRQQQPEEQKRRREGLGSGVIVSRDGHIVTNYHVIKDVDEIQVKLLETETLYDAEVIGFDEITDLAVISIKPDKPLSPAELGDSDTLRIGEWAIAIGNPFGLEESVTVGVISALGRTGFKDLPSRYQDFIQTDASINLGNSGGALVNIKGEVIGINTFIMSPYIAQGLGFAIPVNIVKNVYQKLVQHGHISRGYLGVIPQEITPAMARMWSLADTEGVVIAHVEPNSAADAAGMKIQDVVKEFDGKKVFSEEQFRRMVADTPAGKEVELKIIRNGKEQAVTVKLGELETEGKQDSEIEDSVQLGFEVSEITPDIQQRFGIKQSTGVIITEIRGGSSAETELLPGDIIQQINKRVIRNIGDYRQALGEIQPGDEVIILIKRADHTLFVELQAE